MEVLAEAIVFGAFFAWTYIQKKRNDRKLTELQDRLSQEKLNNSESDEVLLIHNIDYLSSEEGMEAFNKASIVLLRDDSELYNTVIKNQYGGSGVIKSK